MENFRMPSNKTISKDGREIQIKQFINFEDLQVFVQSISEKSIFIDDNGGYIGKSIFSKDLQYFYNIIKMFTDIELDEQDDLVDVYNNIVGSGLYKEIIENIPEHITKEINDKIWEAERLYDEMRLEENSLNNIVKKFLDNVDKKLPNAKEIEGLFKKLPTIINKVAPDKLKILNDVFALGKSMKKENIEKESIEKV